LQEAEILVGVIIGTQNRFKAADFSTPWMSSLFSIIIPVPNSSMNFAALIDPLGTEVLT
jgi:hypothetical protein